MGSGGHSSWPLKSFRVLERGPSGAWLKDEAQPQHRVEDPQEGGSEAQRIVSQQDLDALDLKPRSSRTHPTQVRLKDSKEPGGERDGLQCVDN